MKKSILAIVAFFMSVVAANAQTYALTGGDAHIASNSAKVALKMKRNTNAGPSRIALESGERLMGYYTGDDRGNELSGLSINVRGDYKAGCDFSEDVTSRFIGGQIVKVRFAVWNALGPSKVTVYKAEGTKAPEEITSEPLAETVVGWNEVKLSQPVTIEKGVRYVLAYDFTQKINQWPIAVDCDVNHEGGKPGGLLVYGNLGSGEGWYNMGTANGNLLIQAIVKGGNFTDDDIALKELATYGNYAQRGEKFNFLFSIKNSGNNIPESYKLKVLLDNVELPDAEMNLPEQLTAFFQTVIGSFTVPADAAVGQHVLTVKVVDINGKTPVEYVEDDVLSMAFNAFDYSYPRTKQLVEHFTSTHCSWCPYGYDVLNGLCGVRGDIAWVSLHGNMSAQLIDEYTVDESAYITNFSTTGYPAASFNRMCFNAGVLGVNIAAPPADQAPFVAQIDEAMNLVNMLYYPSFASVDIESSYNKESKRIDVKVMGERSSEDFEKFVGNDAVLTVYLCEDSLVSIQCNGGPYIKEYPHNNVLRYIATKPLGDNIEWTDSKFERDFYLDLAEINPKGDWKLENMKVIAFISLPIGFNEKTGKFTTKADDSWVVNTNMVKLNGDIIDGIGNVSEASGDARETARYSVDGRRLQRPAKGLNIVKMSDGSTIKVMVK